MCGLAGVIGFADGARAVDAVRRMTAALHRRGPDAEGIYRWDSAVLGHRRLAIFDLSEAGRQPMLSADSELGCVFNGAIYNFVQLREELASRGHVFVSRTDTEVLLHGYKEWGIDSLVQRLRGMFAFAIWDNRRQRLFLVRDRLGVKPLLYEAAPEGLAFASTARALKIAGFGGEFDDEAIGQFLENGFVPEDCVVYRRLRKLPPASILEWTARRTTVRSYWRPPQPSEQVPRFDDAVERTEELLLDAVRVRLEADVPVGALLSGGIDSGLVCWAIRKLGGDITAFTVGTPGFESDESRDAQATARELDIEHRLLAVSAPDPTDLRTLIAAYGEPFACASALGLLKISQEVASEARVLLTGDGGDDVFLGYPRHRHLYVAQTLARRLTPSMADWWYRQRNVVPPRGLARRAVHFLDYATGGLGAFLDTREGLPSWQRQGLLGPRLVDHATSRRARPWELASARAVLQQYLAHDLQTQFVSEYLTKVDGATMFHALEARSPFLDQELWAFAAGLPERTRLNGGRLKAILRELAARRISHRVARGRKRGFMVPTTAWVAGPWRAYAQQLLTDSVVAAEGWVSAAALQAKLRETPDGGRAPLPLWYFMVLEEWIRFERSLPDAQKPIAA